MKLNPGDEHVKTDSLLVALEHIHIVGSFVVDLETGFEIGVGVAFGHMDTCCCWDPMRSEGLYLVLEPVYTMETMFAEELKLYVVSFWIFWLHCFDLSVVRGRSGVVETGVLQSS